MIRLSVHWQASEEIFVFWLIRLKEDWWHKSVIEAITTSANRVSSDTWSANRWQIGKLIMRLKSISEETNLLLRSI